MNGSSRYPHSAPAQHSYGASVPKRSPLVGTTANRNPSRASHAPQIPARAREISPLTSTNPVGWVCVGTPNDSWPTDE